MRTMGHRKQLCRFFALFFCFLAPSLLSASPQRPDSQTDTLENRLVAVEVMVREETGGLLETGENAMMGAITTSFNQTQMTRDAGTATFQRVPPGGYEVEVRAMQYKTANEQINVVG